MAQQAKVFVDKLDDLSSIPEPTRWRGELTHTSSLIEQEHYHIMLYTV